jgi:hypothetical protein
MRRLFPAGTALRVINGAFVDRADGPGGEVGDDFHMLPEILVSVMAAEIEGGKTFLVAARVPHLNLADRQIGGGVEVRIGTRRMNQLPRCRLLLAFILASCIAPSCHLSSSLSFAFIVPPSAGK